MNRPPFPPPYPMPQVPPNYPPNGGPGSPQAPGAQGGLRAALLTQSQRRHGFSRDAVNKLEAGFSDLDYEAGNVIARVSQNPQQRRQLEMSLAAVRAAKERVRRAFDEALLADVGLQDELQRWMNGQPPSTYWINGQPPSTYVPQPPQSQYQQPPQGQYRDSGAHMPINPALMPEIPPGQLDMRDPRHAAAALLRAEQMPMGGGPQPMMQPQYAAPMQPPMPAPAAPPPQAHYNGQPLPQPSVPVQMQYVDPAQVGAPNMAPPPPVMQYASAEAAQAAVVASHAANVPAAGVTAPAAAQNGAATKPAAP